MEGTGTIRGICTFTPLHTHSSGHTHPVSQSGQSGRATRLPVRQPLGQPAQWFALGVNYLTERMNCKHFATPEAVTVRTGQDGTGQAGTRPGRGRDVAGTGLA